MRTRLAWVLIAVAAAWTPAALAHHSFAAEYDANKPVTLKGTVSKVEWTNPHARFYVDVKDDKGAVTTWNLELASPNVLRRNGWTRTSLNVGEDGQRPRGETGRRAPRLRRFVRRRRPAARELTRGHDETHRSGCAPVRVRPWRPRHRLGSADPARSDVAGWRRQPEPGASRPHGSGEAPAERFPQMAGAVRLERRHQLGQQLAFEQIAMRGDEQKAPSLLPLP